MQLAHPHASVFNTIARQSTNEQFMKSLHVQESIAVVTSHDPTAATRSLYMTS